MPSGFTATTTMITPLLIEHLRKHYVLLFVIHTDPSQIYSQYCKYESDI